MTRSYGSVTEDKIPTLKFGVPVVVTLSCYFMVKGDNGEHKNGITHQSFVLNVVFGQETVVVV